MIKAVQDNPFEIDQKVQNSFKEKTWDETITKDSWMVFKIMAEFVDGYERMAKIGPCVSLFGSARMKPEDPRYELAVDIAEKITEIGFGVITGGGPGIMEAITLIQTHKIGRFPIVLVGTKFWAGLLDWFKNTLLESGMISEEDLSLYRVVDTAEDAVAHIKAFYDKYQVNVNF